MSESQRRLMFPRAQSFVVCREIIEDCRSHEFVLIAPFGALAFPAFPVAFRMSIYAYLTCGHGTYALALQLRDSDDEVRWSWDCPEPIQLENPLERHEFTLYDAVVPFPQPGRYDLMFLANGEELARHVLHVQPSGPR
jgi:hypothetical protein